MGFKELFEHAYEGTINGVVTFKKFCEELGEIVLTVCIYLTVPLWIIPYAIYKKRREIK